MALLNNAQIQREWDTYAGNDFLTPAKKEETVSRHYEVMDIEPWDVCDTWPLEQRIGAYRHGVLKYTMRMGSKDARLMEARKALAYAKKLVETLENTDDSK